jgi:hypothetical protein
MVGRGREHGRRGQERSGFHPNIKIHTGRYAFPDRGELYKNLEGQVQQEWKIVADGLGLDVNKFPARAIHFWAKKPPKHERQILEEHGDHKRWWSYRRMPLLVSPNEIAGRIRQFPPRRVLDIKFDRNGNAESGNIGHELLHAYALQHGIPFSFGNVNKLFGEGFANAGKVLITTYGHSDVDIGYGFAELKNMAVKGEISVQGGNWFDNLDWGQALAYHPANGILHLYLIRELGGIEKMKNRAFAHLRSVDKLTRAYETVYGNSYIDLLQQAQHWYNTVVKPIGGPQNLRRKR